MTGICSRCGRGITGRGRGNGLCYRCKRDEESISLDYQINHNDDFEGYP